MALDNVQLQFNGYMIFVLNSIIMFNLFLVSLSLRRSDFTVFRTHKKAAIAGLIGQFIALPLVSFLMARFIPMQMSLALAVILVGACPGGNLSNVFSYIARGNLPLAVALTAIGFLIATISTPFNFVLYANLHPDIKAFQDQIHIPVSNFLFAVIVNLGLPLLAGAFVGSTFPRFYERIAPHISKIALSLLAILIVLAFKDNWHIFAEHWHEYIWICMLQHTLGLLTGYVVSKLAGLNQADTRTVSIEVGIQNSPFALVMVLTFLPQLGGAAVMLAFWGVWQTFATWILSLWWRRH